MWRLVRPVNKDIFAAWWWSDARRGSEALRLVDATVGEGHVAVDVGGAYGLFTYRLARLVGPAGEVHAFEPNPQHWPGLASAGRKQNVTLHRVALSDAAGRTVMHVPSGRSGEPDPGMGTLERSPSGAEAVEVEVETLDRVLDSVPRLDFVKIDVEGHEQSVLEGARGVLAAHRPTLLVEIEQRHRQRPVAETFELLASLGYTGAALTERGLLELDAFDVERHQLALIADDPGTEAPPSAYVNDFVFVPEGRELPGDV